MDAIILGDGILGSSLVSVGGYKFVSRKKNGVDINLPHTYIPYIYYFDTIINCIAFTDTYSKNKKLHWETNYVAVYKLARYCEDHGKKLVHISTDFVYSNSPGIPAEEDVPVHNADWYSYTKLLGDAVVQAICSDHLVCRGTHKTSPFKHDMAWVDRVGNFDYIDVMTGLIHGLIQDGASGVYNVGTEVKTMYDMAKKTNPLVKEGYAPTHVPKDTTMNVDKMMRFLKIKEWLT